MMANRSRTAVLLAAFLFPLAASAADEIDMNTAQMQAMDKITGRVSIIEVPVGGAVNFGSFSVVVRSCKTRPESEIPENFAFVDITDKSFDQSEYNIFKGWMFSSRPSVHAVEHPIYDVWLLKCINSTPDSKLLLTPEQLAERDRLPRLQEVRAAQEEERQNSFETVTTSSPIRFKDSMYREKAAPQKEPTPEVKQSGSPENLLNIKESYEDEIEDEDLIEVPADELTEAINREVSRLENEKNDTTLDEELSQQIDRELSKDGE